MGLMSGGIEFRTDETCNVAVREARDLRAMTDENVAPLKMCIRDRTSAWPLQIRWMTGQRCAVESLGSPILCSCCQPHCTPRETGRSAAILTETPAAIRRPPDSLRKPPDALRPNGHSERPRFTR